MDICSINLRVSDELYVLATPSGTRVIVLPVRKATLNTK